MEAQIAWREVELLVVGGVIGDVHLAVGACDGAVALEHDSCVMVQACRPALKERGDDDHTKLLGQLAEELRRRSWDRLGEVEVRDVFRLAEVERVVQLLEHDELCAPPGEVADALCEP